MKQLTIKNHITKTSPKELYKVLLELLRTPMRSKKIETLVEKYGKEFGISASSITRLKSTLFEEGLKKVKIRWQLGAKKIDLYSSLPLEKLNALEVAQSFYNNAYVCYHSALFWNELIDQVPKTIYIAHERPVTSVVSPRPPSWDDMKLRDAFIKSPQAHNQTAIVGDYKIILLHRAFSDSSTIETKYVSFDGTQTKIRTTNLERTLIDCAAVPENTGGIISVIDAFKRAKNVINYESFLKIYLNLDFKYPHWQRVGFLLEKFCNFDLSVRWKKDFGIPKNKFYLMKGYRADWKFDFNWNLFYPSSVLK